MSNSIYITDAMKHTLDEFLASKTIVDVDRHSFQLCNLKDNRFKITISLVFMRDWDSIESDNYSSVIIENKGAVFTFPCYWLSIPKELSMSYFEYIINDFYQNEVSKWSVAEGFISDDNGNINNSGCNCNTPSTPVTPPCPYIANV